MAFAKDLKDGESIEQEILAIINTKFPDAIKETGKFCREFYDVLIPKNGEQKEIRIEIKADLYKSANFAFEVLGRGGKSTGVIKTTSHYWLQFRNEKYFIWETKKIKRYLLGVGKKYIRDCGDDKASAAWIVPEEMVIKECPPLAIVERHSKKLLDFIK